jgi:peroxiredoxin
LILALTLIGLGLASFGVVIFLLRTALPASSRDFSAVPAKVDIAAPKLTLTNLDGEPVSLEDHRGSVVLVNLWATWCPPCREEMPTLQAFYEKYKPLGFVLIAIDQGETGELVRSFVAEFGLSFPVWMDEYSRASRAFNTMSLPSSYVVDRRGRIRLMWIGGISEVNLELSVPAVIFE